MTAQIITFPDPLACPPPIETATCALFLDLDGVLAPIVDQPDGVRPDPRRTFVLRRLAERLERRIAIVSGRTLAEVAAITENAVTAVAGVHGLHRRTALGEEIATLPDPDLAEAAAVFQALARAQPQLIVEEKGLSCLLYTSPSPRD